MPETTQFGGNNRSVVFLALCENRHFKHFYYVRRLCDSIRGSISGFKDKHLIRESL